MGHPGGEGPHRGHAVGEGELDLHALAVGDVLGEGHQGGLSVELGEDGEGVEDPHRAVAVEEAVLAGGEVGAPGGDLDDALGDHLPVVGVDVVDHLGADELLGPRVAEDRAALGVHVDEAALAVHRHRHRRVLDEGAEVPLGAAQGGLGPVLVEGHLDGGLEGLGLEGLDHVAKGLGGLGPGEGLLVGVGGEVDHRHLGGLADALGGVDAVHLPGEAHVHEHQIRAHGGRQAHRLLAGGHHPGVGVAEGPELPGHVLGDDPLVLDDEDPGAGGVRGFGHRGVRKRMVNRVPGRVDISIHPWS